jgi:hypothetical protein
VIATQTGGPNATQQEVEGGSFSQLIFNIAMARDLAKAAPSVPVQPWLSPKYGDWGLGYSYLSSGNISTDEVKMWEENVFHVALSTGSTEFLWWQPGSQRPLGLGMDLLSQALHELDWVSGADRHPDCQMKPIEAEYTRLTDFVQSFIMSAMQVKCSDGFQREVYRFTPRCTKTIWCTWSGAEYPPKNGSTSPSWRIGSGFNIVPVEGGVVQLAEVPVSTAGAWLIKDRIQ